MTRLKGVAPCAIEGCDRLYYGRGWCQTHYMRWYRSGDPLGSTLEDPRSRFSSFLMPAPSGCIIWLGAVSDTGYGNFWINGGTVLAHRQALKFAGRSIPHGLEVDHLCRVRRCVNPVHLDVVDHGENNRRQPHNAGRFKAVA